MYGMGHRFSDTWTMNWTILPWNLGSRMLKAKKKKENASPLISGFCKMLEVSDSDCEIGDLWSPELRDLWWCSGWNSTCAKSRFPRSRWRTFSLMAWELPGFFYVLEIFMNPVQARAALEQPIHRSRVDMLRCCLDIQSSMSSCENLQVGCRSLPFFVSECEFQAFTRG